MNSPAKLTDTQFAILSEASQRKDRCLIPPRTLKGGAAQKLAAKLLKAGLVREIKAKTGKEAWRRDEETGQAYSLKLTDAGLKAIAADERELAIRTQHGRFAEHERGSAESEDRNEYRGDQEHIRPRQLRRRPGKERRSRAWSNCSNAIRARSWMS